MDIIFALFLLTTFSSIHVESQEHCNFVYECCKKLDLDCVEYCGPVLECADNKVDQNQTTVTEASTEVIETTNLSEEPSTTQGLVTQNVIGVSLCRKGFQLDSNGRCRKLL